MIIRAKNKDLFTGKNLTKAQQQNSAINVKEAENGMARVASMPRRLVLELTNRCNLNCIMCGRNAAEFSPTTFSMEIFKDLEPLFDTIEEVTLMGWGEPTIHPEFLRMLETIDRHSARKYFCTNGMLLDGLKDAIFQYHVDVFAVSVDGATKESNARIRRGSDLDKITASLKDIVQQKRQQGLLYPYINFVFCAMDSNLEELPKLVELAADIGLEEVKVVFLTAFAPDMESQALWGQESRIRQVFQEAEQLADNLGISLKLPHIPGEDPAGEQYHKQCFMPWRDFFVGSDGYVRPCMSTSTKFFQYDLNREFLDMFNDPCFQEYRNYVNNRNMMDANCRNCYQSSVCNWNRRSSFLQTGEIFSPNWNKRSTE